MPTELSLGDARTYQWSRNANGTFNIHDVEVFAEHSRDLGMKLVEDKDGKVELARNVIDINKDWLQVACGKNRSRFSLDNYTGPLKVFHKEGGLSRPLPAGGFILKEVREANYEGKPISILYADFVKIPAQVFEQIKAGLLPYRSVEISDVSAMEIDGISLLDTDTPFFRFPNLLPGKEVFGAYYKLADETTVSLTRGLVRGGKGARAVLCYFAGKGMYEEKDEDLTSKGKEKPDQGSDTDDEELEESMSQEIKAALENMSSKFDKFCSVLERVIGTVTPPEKTEKDAPVKEKDQKVQASEKDAAYEGRLAAAEGKLLAIESAKALGAKVDASLDRLKAYNLGADAKEKLTVLVADSADPDKAIAAYEAAIKQFGVQMPGRWDPKTMGLPAGAGDLPAEVLEYKADEAKFAKAVKLAEAFKWSRDRGVVAPEMALKDFLKYNLSDLKSLVTV